MPKHYPLISIIIPNYNNAIYLEHCLDSILTQTYPNLEIIISDDCSTDTSREIIEKYAQKFSNIKPILLDTNIGVTVNRIQAIDNATGEFITTIDSDDYYYDKNKILSEYNFYIQHDRDVIIYSNSALVTPEDKIIRVRGNKKNIKEGDILYDIITRSSKIPYNFLMKKKQYLAIGGYDSEIPLYEDWDLKIRLAAKYEFYYSGIVGNAIVIHNTGLSSTSRLRHIYWMSRVFWKNFKHLKQKKIQAVFILHRLLIRSLTKYILEKLRVIR